MSEAASPQPPSWVRPLRIVIFALVALLAALLIWQAVGGDDEDADDGADGAARVVSAGELAGIADEAEGPIYWAGERDGAALEYSEVADRVYVRYLTGGASAGDPGARFLTIATYPLPAPVAALRANARRTGNRLLRARGGALAWVNPDRPQSVYLADPGAEHQVEVYDPDPARARATALSGEVVPAG